MKYFLFFVTIVGLISVQCESPCEYVEYHHDGSVYFICNTVDGKKHGKGRYFYEDGRLGGDNYWVNDEKDGQEVLYYPNGNVEVIHHYQKGKLSGNYAVFEESGDLERSGRYFNNKYFRYQNIYRNGRLDRTVEAVLVGDTATVLNNQILRFDPVSGIDHLTSNYFLYERMSNPVVVEQPFSVSLFLTSSGYPIDELGRVKVVVGDFDMYYNPIPGGVIDTLFFEEYFPAIDISRTFHEPGIHYIRGIILNGKRLIENRTGYRDNRLYFEYLAQVVDEGQAD